MEGEKEESEFCFTTAMTLAVKGCKNIPQRYILPPLQRPNTSISRSSITLPVIDLSLLNDPLHRSQVVNEIHSACSKLGFFQLMSQGPRIINKGQLKTQFKVINHGIPVSIMEDALDAAKEFFHLPIEEKMHFASGNVHEPVRYGTSLNHVTDKVFCWRDFLKHYANPISEWIQFWPLKPPCYRHKMGSYAKAVHVLQKQLMGVVIEGLGLNVNYLNNDMEKGCQLMVMNCYPSCPKPDLALGMPAHTDYGTMTILNQNQQGLEIMDRDDGIWHPVPFIKGALIVQLGDQTEVMSNGRYKSINHRATVNMERTRLSIVSIHSLPIDKKVGPIPDLVNDQNPIAYKEGSFREFLDHISANSVTGTKYIETLRIL